MNFLNEQIVTVLERVENEEKELAANNQRTNWIIEREAVIWICEYILEKKPEVIVECGTSVGYSTIWFAAAAKTYGGRVISIEKDTEKVERAEKNMQEAKLENIELITGDAQEILENWKKGKIDLLFLDANKKGYLPQFLAAKPYLTAHATVVADNVIDMQERVKDFIEYMENEETEFKARIIEIEDGLLVAEREYLA